MGTDKAFVVVDGRPMVVVVAEALSEAGCHPVECQGGDLERLAELGLTGVADAVAGAGPVAAIGEALDRFGGPIVIAACDLGRLDAPPVRAVIEAGAELGAVAVAASDGRRHLLSYWTPAARDRLPPAGSYREALEAVGAVEVPVEGTALQNFNTPEQL